MLLLQRFLSETNRSGHPVPPAFVLFTTQRSGSTWVCEVLHAQPGIMCGKQEFNPGQAEPGQLWQDRRGELMLSAQNSSTALSWDDWRRDAEQAFTIIAKEALHRRHTDAVGFKLMYNQVPHHLRNNFIEWLVQQSISVLHLVREATVLRVAPRAHHADERSESNSSSYSSSAADSQRLGAETLAKRVREEEQLDFIWATALIHSHNLHYHRISYERLLVRGRDETLAKAVSAIGGRAEGLGVPPPMLQQLHPQTCEARVLDFESVRPMLSGTRSLPWCELLAAEAGSESLG